MRNGADPDACTSPRQGERGSFEGRIDRVVYANDTTGWTVAAVRADRAGLVTVVGLLPGILPGERVRLSGRWSTSARYGEQFLVDSVEIIPPSTREGIEQYLASGCFPGVGKVMAARLVGHFGEETLRVIRDNPRRLLEIEGVGLKKVESIKRAWLKHFGMHEVMVFLRSYGVSGANAIKIYKRYGAEAVRAVKEDPYRLAADIEGVGFAKADRIAAALGYSHDSPRRAQAAVTHRLSRFAEEGHVYLPRQLLVQDVSRLLGVSDDLIDEAIGELERQERVVVEPSDEGDAIFLPGLHSAEAGSAWLLVELLRKEGAGGKVDLGKAIAAYERQSNLVLSAGQREAIRDSLSAKVMVLTGGPGTGKTTIIKGIVNLFRQAGLRTLLAAPTGRAARKLADTTGFPARTVHRLLEFNPREGVFGRSEDNPLDADLLIIDEASMIDCALFYQILRAVPQSSRLILVGDVDQLPSVGPGSVLRDVIDSGVVKVVRLGEIFRQAEGSLIVSNAHLVNRGEMPRGASFSEGADFFFVDREDPEELLSALKLLVSERIPERFGVDPLCGIQVLSPMHRGLLGTVNLNRELRALLNPAGEKFAFGGRSFSVGDKVMQVRNNYELEVFNGDIGVIVGLERGRGKLAVSYDGRIVRYGEEAVDQVTLAYTCSVHKSQGSEFPAVVLVLHTQHYPMLQRNLLYTGITRGQKLVVLIGSKKALALAVRNDRIRRRYTRLRERLEARRCDL